jgi:preprotein translocase subunit YajC
MDDSEHWDVSALGQLEQGIAIFKGPRLRTDNIVVDGPNPTNASVEPYFTPSAILQDKRDSVKWLDLSKATAAQKAAYAAVRVQKGDLLVTRSGTIGRVAYITTSMHGSIVSDDAIRIRIADERLRSYVFAYLQTSLAQDQLRINEYGSVQQHLEPAHIRDLLVPVPSDWTTVKDAVKSAKTFFKSKERQDRAMGGMRALEQLMSTQTGRPDDDG